MEYVDPNKSFPSQLANGYIVLNNVFSQPLNAPSGSISDPPDTPIAPAGNTTGELPSSNLNPGSSEIVNGWTWYFYNLDYENESEGYFKDSDDNGWEYEGSNNNANRTFTFISADEYPPDI